MKRKLHITTLTLVFMLLVATSIAQTPFPMAMAKCKDGILPSRYQFNLAENSPKTVLDTISLDCARSIYSFEVGYKNPDNNLAKYDLLAFQLEVIEHGDTTIIAGVNAITDEMRSRLARVADGAVIYFQAIRAKSSEGGFWSTEPTGYIVR